MEQSRNNSSIINKLKGLLGRKRFDKLYSDLLVCFAITLTSGFYYFESYQPFMDQFRGVLLVFFIFMWGIIAMQNGFIKRKKFLVIGAFYWVIPLAILFLGRDNSKIENYSKLVDILMQIARIMVEYPVKYISDILNCNTYISVAIIVCYVVILFFSGVFIRNYKRQ